MRRNCTHGFSLIEVLVASTILVSMMGFLVFLMNQTTRVWMSTTAKVEQFREARTGFERVTSRLSQATLNTYWDYNNPAAPTRYERRSELRFLTGDATTLLGGTGKNTHAVFFNAPLGVSANTLNRGAANGVNTVGYFLELADDSAQRPPFITSEMIPPRWRFRLMEFSQPTENFSLYQFTSGLTGTTLKSKTYQGTDWFKTDANKTSVALKRAVTENTIALIITPRLSKTEETPLQQNPTHSPLAPNYSYDSTTTNADPQLNPLNQLPPVVQITMVATDERSADLLNLDSNSANIFGIASLFKDTRKFTEDLAALEQTLNDKRVRYRIFTTNVHIRAAKWSREQAN